MDTLVIVRKIREAEALADTGKHGEARRLLEPLLTDNGLTETHRKLVTKKLELFKKQQERMTRIISRRGTATSVRDTADESSARTAIRSPIEDQSKSERPTDLTIEKDARGAPTEVVPRARDVDTEVPERRHKLKIEPRAIETSPSRPDSGRRPAIEGHREVKRPPAASDSQELAPVSDTDQMDALEDATAEDPRKTDMFVPPPQVKEEESAPTISRYAVDRPAYPAGHNTPEPGTTDTPVPQPTPMITRPALSHASGRPAEPPRAKSDRLVRSDLDSATVRDVPSPAMTVRDSILPPGADTVMSPMLPEKEHDDSTFLMAEDYFTSRATARNRERSNPELKALADRLPDDDLRRELALEVVKLRQQLESAEKEKRDSTRVGSRKITREDRPESGSFHIPASQVNTIVRRAAGTDDIEVHMPGRDEEAQDLKVLRRDSVRGKKTTETPTDRIALAQDYIDAAQINRPSLFKPVATWLGVAVVLAIIAWAVHLGWQSFSRADGIVEITDRGVGPYELGTSKSAYPDIEGKQGTDQSVRDDRGWLIQYSHDGTIRAVSATGPWESANVEFNGDPVALRAKPEAQALSKHFGGSMPPFSREVWDSNPTYTLRFESRLGDRALEFVFDTGKNELLWIRLVDTVDEPKPPKDFP